MLDIGSIRAPNSADVNLVPNPSLFLQYLILRIRMEANDDGKLEPVSCRALRPVKPFGSDQDIPLIDLGELAISRLRTAVMATRQHPLLVHLFETGFALDLEDPIFVTSCTVTVQLWVTNTAWLNAIKPALRTAKNQRYFIQYCLLKIPENPINPVAFGYVHATALVGDQSCVAYHTSMGGQAQASSMLNDFIINKNLEGVPVDVKQPLTIQFRTWTQEEFNNRTPELTEEQLKQLAADTVSQALSTKKSKLVRLPVKQQSGDLQTAPKKKKKKKLKSKSSDEFLPKRTKQQQPLLSSSKKKKKKKSGYLQGAAPVVKSGMKRLKKR